MRFRTANIAGQYRRYRESVPPVSVQHRQPYMSRMLTSPISSQTVPCTILSMIAPA